MSDPVVLWSRPRDAEIILDCISDGVITIDLQKRVTFLNRAMRALLGFEGELPGNLLACDVLVQSNICSSQECALERALCGERVSNFEAMVRRRDGSLIPVSINTDFLCNEEGRLIGLIEVIRDISLSQELTAKVTEVNELKHRLGEQTNLRTWLDEANACKKFFQGFLPLLPQKHPSSLPEKAGQVKNSLPMLFTPIAPEDRSPS